jgi:acyl-CoA synthetase (AMP-forming)/AMP-acid ligase II
MFCSSGISSGARVGLIFDKSPFAIASMIAAWKAGAAYVPINTEAPQAQVLYILSDSGAQTILVHSATEANVRAMLSGTLWEGEGEKISSKIERRVYFLLQKSKKWFFFDGKSIFYSEHLPNTIIYFLF